jgi:hypothetical protein
MVVVARVAANKAATIFFLIVFFSFYLFSDLHKRNIQGIDFPFYADR